MVPSGRERLATTIAQGLQLQQYPDAGIRPSVNVFTATLEGPARNAFDFVAPALLALALSQLGLFGTGNQILIARARGQLQRLRCTTLSGLEIIVSQIAVRLGMAVVQVGLLLLAAHLAFGFSIQGSGYQLVLTGFLGAVTLSVLGYAIGGLAPTLESGTAAIMLVNFFMMFCGQVFFDLRRDQHAAVQALTYANPVLYLSDSFREVIVGQPSTLGYWPNQLIVAGWLLFFVVVALFGFNVPDGPGVAQWLNGSITKSIWAIRRSIRLRVRVPGQAGPGGHRTAPLVLPEIQRQRRAARQDALARRPRVAGIAGEHLRGIGRNAVPELVYASPGTYRPLVNLQGIASPAPVHPLAEAIAVEAAYEPELDVFLGPAHIDIAHDVFQASSEIALDLLTLDANGSISRKTMAPLLMRTVADVLLDEPDRAPFLGVYQGYWLARDAIRLDHLTGEFESKAMALRNARHPAVPGHR